MHQTNAINQAHDVTFFVSIVTYEKAEVRFIRGGGGGGEVSS